MLRMPCRNLNRTDVFSIDRSITAILSGFPLYLPLDRPGIFLWREDVVRAPRDSGKIAIFRVVMDFQVKAGAIGEQRLQLPDFTQSHRAFLRRGESPFVPEGVKI